MALHNRPSISCPLALAVLSLSARAQAQVDVNPPRPNVLLLVDSSGSMEYKTSSTTYPACVTTGTGSEKSRWIDLVEVLTGTIPDYRCKTISRSGSAFLNEYRLLNVNANGAPNPPDYLYPIPYHRPMSGTCSPTPTSNPDTIGFCQSTATKPCSFSATDKCDFPKTEGGLLDSFVTEIRFGLMTFDSATDPSTDIVGNWSYFYQNSAKGAPRNCSAVANQEVGARNANAPLWEGRMVAFGPAVSNNEVEELRTRNEKIQNILLSTRPYGATPIAGMLRDAQDFFWNDPNPDGTDPDGSKRIAPKNDPYNIGKCRESFIVLLTDGEPNMDLRPYCEGTNPACGSGIDACCPFKKPEDTAWALANDPSHPPVKTFVVGFAVTEIKDDLGNAIDCQSLTQNDITTGICANPSSKGLQICCTLNRIAYNGGTEKAYFASSVEALRASLSEILSKASKGTTSRTVPVFASTSSSVTGNTTFRFYTSFAPKIDGSGLWQGVIDRQRFVCDGGTTPTAKAIDRDSGDDFVQNVNTSTSPARNFYSVVGATSGTDVYSTRSIRMQPPALPGDGVGIYSGSLVSGSVSSFPNSIPAQAMALTSTPCMSESLATADGCRSRYLKWLVGADNGTTYHRCKTPGVDHCNLIADIFHSVPAVVGSPTESLRDEGYQRFSRSSARTRPLVLYTSTNDGLLHAFKVASNDLTTDTSAASRVLARTNNELWAFLPPAVLPRIPSEYPNVHQLLLDGAPVVKDVVGTKPSGSATILLERDLATTATDNADWRTILVQSFGGSYPGYFALDVTNPVAGPKFLWQLTTDSAGNSLFGDAGGTPTIATLYFDPTNGNNPKEIPVAILPGGNGGTPPSTSAACNRADLTAVSAFESDIRPRSQVPCYDDTASTTDRAAARRARSLTIVRLDTGEIIRTFRRSASDAPTSIAGRITLAPLDSPITGQPVAYPGWTGAIADRAYVGDRDGTLWRLDLASHRPSDWSIKLFFDAYHGSTSVQEGQPIATTPIVSTNQDGQVVVLFSTGSQEDLVGTAQTVNYVYSIREVPTTNATRPMVPKVNWYRQYTAGTRVAGPMTLFSSVLYFSTYSPPSSSYSCDAGTSSIWGMHFVTPEDSQNLNKGGKAALPEGGNASSSKRVQELTSDGTLIAAGSTIFGVGVAQLQGCYATTEVTDSYLGMKYDRIESGGQGKYQLVVQTGKAGASSAQGSTNYATIDLPQPDTSPRISAWALVME